MLSENSIGRSMRPPGDSGSIRRRGVRGVREPQAPRAEAFAEHPVLGLQVRDGQLLPPMDPTGDQKDEKLEWGGQLRRSHGGAR